jgi:hypothetical protein
MNIFVMEVRFPFRSLDKALHLNLLIPAVDDDGGNNYGRDDGHDQDDHVRARR